MHDLGADFADERADRAVELAFGEQSGAFASGVDEVEHAFGLRQIEFAVEERPAREFAVLSEAGPRSERQSQGASGREASAVAVYLRHVLAREAARAGHEHSQRRFARPGLVIIPGNEASVQHDARAVRSGQPFAAPHGAHDIERTRSGDADDADSAAGPGADRRDRIVFMLEQGEISKNN